MAIGLLFGAALYYLGDWFFKDEIVLFRDLHHYFYPLREYTIQCFKRGIFPWWNPYIMLGTPHFAAMQFDVLYPLTFIYFIGSFPFAFNLFIFVHLFLTTVFAFLFFRELKFSTLACGWGALSWMMSGYLASAINLLNILGSITWLPLVLLLFRRRLIKQDRRYCLWSALSLLMMFLGSEAGITVITIWILLGYALVYGWNNCDVIKTKFFAEFALRVIAGIRMTARVWLPTIALFLGLSAFQWIPSLEYLLQSERVQIDFEQATTWSVPPWDLLNLFVPFITDPWIPRQDYWVRQSLLTSYYAGSLPWIFLAWLLKWRRTAQVKWLLIGLIFSLAFVLGKYTPVYQAFYYFLPGLSFIRYPARLFFIPTFLLCWLLVYGLDGFLKTLKKFPQKQLADSYLRIAFIFAAGLLLLRKWLPRFPDDQPFFAKIALLNLWTIPAIWMMGWFLLWFVSRFRKYRRWGLVGLSLLLIWDLGNVHRGINNTVSTKEFLQTAPSVEFLKKQTGYFRVCPSPKLYSQFQYLPAKDFRSAMTNSAEFCTPDQLVPFGIADVSGYDSIYLERYGKLWGALMSSKSPTERSLYHLLNARFLLMPQPMPVKQKGFELVYQSHDFYIYENSWVLPRAFLAPRVVLMSDPEKILEKIRDPQFQPEEEVILEEQEDRRQKTEDREQKNEENRNEIKGRVEIVNYTPNRVEIKVETNTPQTLVLSDAYYPGWRATVDGQAVPVFRADYYLRAVQIPPGNHSVRFFYRPWWFYWAPGVSLLAFLASFVLWHHAGDGILRLRDQKRREDSQDHNGKNKDIT